LLLAKYSPALASYITEVHIKGKKHITFYHGKDKNQLIQGISTTIRNVIQQKNLCTTFFSVSLDTTFDIFRKEQLSLVFRYINKTSGTVCERLVAVRETLLTTENHLFTMFDNICKALCWSSL